MNRFIKQEDKIAQFDKICEVQSDKATVEITSRYDGIVKKLYYKPGEIAKVGAPLIDILPEGAVESVDDSKVATPESHSKHETEQKPVVAKEEYQTLIKDSSNAHGENEYVLATPAVRRMAKELGIDLNSVTGTGKAGRITKEDLLSFSESKEKPSIPQGAAGSNLKPVSESANETVVKLSQVQKAMVKSMTAALQIPHFGFTDDIDLTNLKRFRGIINSSLKDSNDPIGKISFMPFIVKAFSLALSQFPLLNAKLSLSNANDPQLIYRSSHNINVAIDTPNGLVVPSVKNVEQKSIYNVALNLKDLIEKAQKGKLGQNDLKGGTATISNIGNIGGTVLKPVLLEGTVCICAIGKVRPSPVWVNNTWEKRDVVTVSFSADHRVVDGASVARFFLLLKKYLEHPELLSLGK